MLDIYILHLSAIQYKMCDFLEKIILLSFNNNYILL